MTGRPGPRMQRASSDLLRRLLGCRPSAGEAGPKKIKEADRGRQPLPPVARWAALGRRLSRHQFFPFPENKRHVQATGSVPLAPKDHFVAVSLAPFPTLP